MALAKDKINKVVLAYSGGLDTSIILKWLQTEYEAEVVTFTADLGQGEELEPARKKAEMMGIKEIYIEDVREEFVSDFVFPMFRANTAYEGVYLLGTSIARPLISKRLVEIARETGADAIAHGATGKGNDQVRFELSAYALDPNIKVIAPWRDWSFKSRTDLLEFAKEHQIPVPKDKEGEAPFSVDANLLHSSSEGKVLEDPALEASEHVYQRTISPMDAPDVATEIEIEFEKGDAVGLNGKRISAATMLTELNKLGHDNGIGRLDLVENRFVGMKSRGIYETPGGTILLTAHRAIESITLDRGAAHLKDELMPRYAELIYNGFWFSPEREMLQAAIDHSQAHVEGKVRMKLYKGNVIVTGRESDKSLYSEELVTLKMIKVHMIKKMHMDLFDQGVVTLKIASGPYRSDSYELMVEIADVVDRHSENLVVEVVPSKDSSNNISMLNRGVVDLATIHYFQLITRSDSLIYSPTDLVGKKIAIANFGTDEFRSFWVIGDHYDLPLDGMKWKTMSFEQGTQALLSGEVDAVFTVRSIRDRVLLNLFEDAELKGLSLRYISLDQAAAISIKRPFLQVGTLPKGTFSGKAPTPRSHTITTTVQRVLVTRDDLDEAPIQELTRILFENRLDLIIRPRKLRKALQFHFIRALRNISIATKPSFIQENAEPLTLLVTLAAMLFSGLLALRSRFVSIQKDRMDSYNYVLLDIAEKANNASNIAEIDYSQG
ncbi:Argininosuccinate synthase [Nymphon striatum]|nr:Argininosuccinate synthase [Nymphon striatum]